MSSKAGKEHEVMGEIRSSVPTMDEIERQALLIEVLRSVLMPVWHGAIGKRVRAVQRVWNANIVNHGPGGGIDYTPKCHEKTATLIEGWLCDLQQERLAHVRE